MIPPSKEYLAQKLDELDATKHSLRECQNKNLEALACLSQVQSHAAAADLSWQEWIELAATVMKSINVQNPESEE